MPRSLLNAARALPQSPWRTPSPRAGFTGRAAVGGEQAEIIDGLPGRPNIGSVGDDVYHPGDSRFVPDETVETPLAPASGPWL